MHFLFASWTSADRICPSWLVVRAVIRPSFHEPREVWSWIWTTSPMQGGGTVADGRCDRRARCDSLRLVKYSAFQVIQKLWSSFCPFFLMFLVYTYQHFFSRVSAPCQEGYFLRCPGFSTHTNTTSFFISDSSSFHFVMNLIVLQVTNL